MNEIVFLSGKGGTGKTSVSASCAYLHKECITCDYDVEASNLHLLFNLRPLKVAAIEAGTVARIDSELCIECRLCSNLCHFDAIQELVVQDILCEGCELCFHICPVDAVERLPRTVGDLYQSSGSVQFGHFHASLIPGGGNSGKVVTQLKDQARKSASENGLDLLISDGPPGIGCSVIASLTGATMVVLVTEPGISAFDDLQRLWKLLQTRLVPATLVINKWDINQEYSDLICKWANDINITVAGKIPFSEAISECIASAAVPASDEALALFYKPIWQSILAQTTALYGGDNKNDQ